MNKSSRFAWIRIHHDRIELPQHTLLQALLGENISIVLEVLNDNCLQTITEMYAGAIIKQNLFVGIGPQMVEDQGFVSSPPVSEFEANINQIMSHYTDAQSTLVGIVQSAEFIESVDQVSQTTLADLATAEPAPAINFELASTHPQFEKILGSVLEVLTEKDKRYGNAALKPLQIFTGKTCVGHRLDDKLARIKNNDGPLRKNDTFDIIGYLILACVENGWEDFKDQLD